MPHFPPPPQLSPRVGPLRRVPPAIFSALLGVLGLGLAWRTGAGSLGVPAGLIEACLGAVSLLFAFGLGAYAGKVALRPGVAAEDASTLPGRTGLAALAMCLMAEGAVLAPYAPSLGIVSLGVGTAGLLVLALAVLPKRLRGTDTAGPITPAMHLVFVGFILVPAAAVRLGVRETNLVPLIWYCVLAFLVIFAATIRPLLSGEAPAALRPLQAIHLAPPSLAASAAVLTGQLVLAVVALALAAVIAAILVLRARWLTEAGFSGFWSAFTFPSASFAGATILIGGAYGSPGVRLAGGVLLVAATVIVLPVVYRVMKLWASGALAAKTNAAIA